MCNCSNEDDDTYTVFLTVNSADRLSGISSNFVVNLQERALFNVRSAKLVYAAIPNVLPNVRYKDGAGNPSSITWKNTVTSTTYSQTVPNGSYDINTLMTAVAAIMNATETGGSSNTYTLTYNTVTRSVTFTGNTSNFYIDFSASSSLYQQFGFPQAVTSTGLSVTGTNCVNLNGVPMIYMTIQEIGYKNKSSNTNDNCTFIIPVDVNVGDTIIYKENTSFTQKFPLPIGFSFSNLSVLLTEPNNATYPLSLGGVDWTFVLKLTLENKYSTVFTKRSRLM